MNILSSKTPYLGASIPRPTRPDDPAEPIRAPAKLMIQLEGPQRYAISIRGERQDLELSSGECFYLAPNAWAFAPWQEPSQTLGIILLRDFLRVVLIRPPLDLQSPSPFFYHTAAPLEPGGLLVSRALNHLAEGGGDTDGARDLVVAMLRRARLHLQNDRPGRPARAQSTWRAVCAYMQENITQPLTRKSIAAAMDLHPNYLSALARQLTSRSFQEALDAARADHAQRLLRNSDLKIDRIARLCGYSNAASLTKAFRRAVHTTPGNWRAGRMVPPVDHSSNSLPRV